MDLPPDELTVRTEDPLANVLKAIDDTVDAPTQDKLAKLGAKYVDGPQLQRVVSQVEQLVNNTLGHRPNAQELFALYSAGYLIHDQIPTYDHREQLRLNVNSEPHMLSHDETRPDYLRMRVIEAYVDRGGMGVAKRQEARQLVLGEVARQTETVRASMGLPLEGKIGIDRDRLMADKGIAANLRAFIKPIADKSPLEFVAKLKAPIAPRPPITAVA